MPTGSVRCGSLRPVLLEFAEAFSCQLLGDVVEAGADGGQPGECPLSVGVTAGYGVAARSRTWCRDRRRSWPWSKPCAVAGWRRGRPVPATGCRGDFGVRLAGGLGVGDGRLAPQAGGFRGAQAAEQGVDLGVHTGHQKGRGGLDRGQVQSTGWADSDGLAADPGQGTPG
jgi:hypothetical protein